MERVAAGPGLSLAYEVSGDPGAPPMVLLHGLGDGAVDWRPVIPAFAAHFRVYALNMRGHGDSDWPGSYSFAAMRDDVVAALDALGLDKVTLVGHSMGGAVAFMVATAHPDRVERLVVEDASPGYPRDRAIPERPDEPLDIDWAVVPAIVSAVNAGEPGGWDDLARITAPTLLVGGGPDSSVRQDKLAETVARIPGGTLITIPAGHHVHKNRPAEFAGAVLAWLRV